MHCRDSLDVQNYEPILPSGNHRSLSEKVGCLAPGQERHSAGFQPIWGLPSGQQPGVIVPFRDSLGAPGVPMLR